MKNVKFRGKKTNPPKNSAAQIPQIKSRGKNPKSLGFDAARGKCGPYTSCKFII